MSYKAFALTLLSICTLQNIHSAVEIENYGNSPLHRVIQKSSYEGIFRILMLIGNQQNYINNKNDLGYTPLHLAVNMPDDGSITLNIKKHPLSMKAVLTYLEDSAEYLHYYVHYRNLSVLNVAIKSLKHTIIQQLLKQKADPNTYNYLSTTPLHDAVRNNDSEAVLLLLGPFKGEENYKDHIHILNIISNTPLHLAAYLGHPEIVKILLREGANKKFKNAASLLPLDLAILGKNKKTIALLQ